MVPLSKQVLWVQLRAWVTAVALLASSCGRTKPNTGRAELTAGSRGTLVAGHAGRDVADGAQEPSTRGGGPATGGRQEPAPGGPTLAGTGGDQDQTGGAKGSAVQIEATGGARDAWGGMGGGAGMPGGAAGEPGGSTPGLAGSSAGVGGITAIAGVAGASATAGRAGAGGAEPCPGTGGPVMVRLPEGYCMDSTEVTRGQYRAWLETNPSTDGQNSKCARWHNNGLSPGADCMDSPSVYTGAGSDNHPVVCVDWCDAHAYCRAVGKRLCGSIEGGANADGDRADASKSQWYNACVSGRADNDYTYGSTYEADYCNGEDNQTSLGGSSATTVPVGSMPRCQSFVPGYEGVFDLSGNVLEWEDSCEVSVQPDPCLFRGGSAESDSAWTCGRVGLAQIGVRDPFIGFRCCAP